MDAPDPLDLIDIDALLTDEERQIRDLARAWVVDSILPEVDDWYEHGEFPARELAKELGQARVPRDAASRDRRARRGRLRAGGAGARGGRQRAAVVRQRHERARDVRDPRRSAPTEQKAEWLPRLQSGEAIGCFGLSEPDSGSDPGSMRTFAKRDGDDWVLSGTKMWITNGSVSDVAIVWANTDDGIRGFVVPCDAPGFSAPDIHKKLSLRASGDLRAGDGRGPTAGRRGAAGGRGIARAAVVSERGAVRDHLGRDGRGARVLRVVAELCEDADPVRPADRLVPADAEEARRHGARAEQGHAARLSPRPDEGGGAAAAAARERREAEQHACGARDRADVARASTAPTASRSSTRSCGT